MRYERYAIFVFVNIIFSYNAYAEQISITNAWESICLASAAKRDNVEHFVDLFGRARSMEVREFNGDLLSNIGEGAQVAWGLADKTDKDKAFIVSYGEKTGENASYSCSISMMGGNFEEAKLFAMNNFRSEIVVDQKMGSYQLMLYKSDLVGFTPEKGFIGLQYAEDYHDEKGVKYLVMSAVQSLK